MLDILKAILYGIVEGISEWLPISSTGHLIVLDGFLHMEETYPDFWPFFLVVIQLGAILAIVVNFFGELNPFSFKKTKLERNGVFKIAGNSLHRTSIMQKILRNQHTPNSTPLKESFALHFLCSKPHK